MRSGVVVITTAQHHSTKPELRFFAGANPARGMSEIRNGEDLWQWFCLEIRLNAFRRSIISQKQFIIISLRLFYLVNTILFNPEKSNEQSSQCCWIIWVIRVFCVGLSELFCSGLELIIIKLLPAHQKFDSIHLTAFSTLNNF